MKKEDRKAALIQELEWARLELAQNVRSVGEDVDMAARFRQSVVHRTTAWLGGAALAGWVLSKIARRRKKPAALPSARASESRGGVPSAGRAGLLLAALHTLFTVFKPAITALATRKLNQLAAPRDGFDSTRR